MGFFEFIFGAVFQLFSLGFLPAAFEMFDGNIHTHAIPYLGYIPEVIINFIAVIFINVSDFGAWIIGFVPFVNSWIEWVYRSPDSMEHVLPWLFGGMGGHRNFITHSLLNPGFLLFLASMIGLLYLVRQAGVFKKIVLGVFVIGCLVFMSHLLADTMPQSWRGSAHIQVYLFFKWFTLNGFFSKIWLYLNVIGVGLISFSAAASVRE